MLPLAVAIALAGWPSPAEARGEVSPAAKRCPDRRAVTTVNGSVRISLRCRGLRKVRIRVVRRPRHGLVGINQRRDRALYIPHRGFTGRDRFRVARVRGKRRWRTTVSVRVTSLAAPEPDAPRCNQGDGTARYRSPVQVTITCTGQGLQPLRVVGGPFSGAIADVQESGAAGGRTLTATYTPNELFAGQDALVVEAVNPAGQAYGVSHLTVLPWRMRAIGDSVTAGFGYFGDGSLMPVDDLLDCKPAAVVSNRCSSNSDAPPSYDGPPVWSPDFGLANDVSWAAQFANDWQGGGHITAPQMFQNRAVTGSAPSDWLPGGILHPQLEAIVAEDPELVVMTLGANPLLSDLLLTADGEECSFEETVAELQACVQEFFDQVDLSARLEQVYTAVLQAPHTRVVAFQYHLAIPALNLFSVWQLEAMTAAFNQQIADAVTNTKAKVAPSQAERLYLIEAQIDPADPVPTELPRFNTGLPPSVHDSWSGVYDCGGLFDVDGPTHQSDVTQDLYELDPDFCDGPPWIIDADSGIHPNRDGYAQFAAALGNVAEAEDLIPPLP